MYPHECMLKISIPLLHISDKPLPFTLYFLESPFIKISASFGHWENYRTSSMHSFIALVIRIWNMPSTKKTLAWLSIHWSFKLLMFKAILTAISDVCMTNLGVYSGCMVFPGDYSLQVGPHFELFLLPWLLIIIKPSVQKSSESWTVPFMEKSKWKRAWTRKMRIKRTLVQHFK